MKNKNLLILLLCLFVYVMGCKPKDAEMTAESETAEAAKSAEPTMSKADSIEQGRYLVTIMGCHDCHSPKIFTKEGQMLFDSTKLLSGHPAGAPMPTLAKKSSTMPQEGIIFSGDLTTYVGPWGTSFSANLTPDVTGLGQWTFDMFKKAITEGKFHALDNGRPIMPPMPWELYRNAKPEHLAFVWTYLHSLPPVSNKVPDYIPPGK